MFLEQTDKQIALRKEIRAYFSKLMTPAKKLPYKTERQVMPIKRLFGRLVTMAANVGGQKNTVARLRRVGTDLFENAYFGCSVSFVTVIRLGRH